MHKFLMAAAAALLALARMPSRRTSLVLGFVIPPLLLFHALWVEREEQYMANVLGRYLSEHARQHAGALPDKPGHFPETAWPVRTARSNGG